MGSRVLQEKLYHLKSTCIQAKQLQYNNYHYVLMIFIFLRIRRFAYGARSHCLRICEGLLYHVTVLYHMLPVLPCYQYYTTCYQYYHVTSTIPHVTSTTMLQYYTTCYQYYHVTVLYHMLPVLYHMLPVLPCYSTTPHVTVLHHMLRVLPCYQYYHVTSTISHDTMLPVFVFCTDDRPQSSELPSTLAPTAPRHKRRPSPVPTHSLGQFCLLYVQEYREEWIWVKHSLQLAVIS